MPDDGIEPLFDSWHECGHEISGIGDVTLICTLPAGHEHDGPIYHRNDNGTEWWFPHADSRLTGLRCPTCRKWETYIGRWDEDGETWRCRGCLRAIGRCTCA